MTNVICYTDGSFNTPGETHGGVVFWNGNTFSSRIHVYSKNEKFVSMRNVGGEIIAAYCAILSTASKIKELNKESMDTYKLTLIYDYRGVGDWLTGAWRTNKKATAWYKHAVDKLLSEVPNLKLELVWIKGHGYSAGNNEADRVAEYSMAYSKKNNIPICLVDELLDV